MTVYLINVFLILFWDAVFLSNKQNKVKKAWFCTIVSIQWILISGLRALTVGADTLNYSFKYSRVAHTSWETVFEALYKVYIEGYKPVTPEGNFLYKDPGYLLFQKICHVFTDDYQVFLLIIAVIIFTLMARFVYKYSEDPCLSYVLFSVLFYSFFAVTGMRQALATALIVFVGFDYIKERKLFKFIFVSILGFLFHKSALVFAPFYLLGAFKVNWKYIGFVSVFTGIVYSAGPGFILKAAEFLGYDKDEVYDLPPYMYVLAIVVVACTVAFFHKRILDNSEDKKWEITATVLAASFSIFALIDQSIMRVQQYYSLFMMLSIPSFSKIFEKHSKLLVRFAFLSVLILYLVKNNPQYKFFWQ